MKNQNYTQEMDAVITGLKDDLKSFYCREDFRRKIREVNDQYKHKRSGYHSRLNELKKMCIACGIDPKALQNPETVAAALNSIPTRKDQMKLLLTRLHDLYLQFPTSYDYMERLVRRLLKGQYETDSVRLAILKKLYLEVKLNATAPTTKYLVAQLTDEETKAYKKLRGSQKREFLVPKLSQSIFETNLELPKIATDLAFGNFTGNGGTRKNLYIFAIAFGMTTDFGGGVSDPETDIEKNLFHDYYQDSLLRYIQKPSWCDSDMPSGEGINYKNFAEVIYLYTIAKFPDLSPEEKLAKAEDLIHTCKQEAKTSADTPAAPPTELTVHFRDTLVPQLMQLPEDQVIGFICRNYYVYNPQPNTNATGYAGRQNTAREKYLELAELLKEYCDGDPENLARGSVQVNNFLEQLKKIYADDDAFLSMLEDKEFGDPSLGMRLQNEFVRLLRKTDELLSQGKTIAMKLWENPDALSKYHRTGLISLYYCYLLNALEADRLVKNYAIVSLPEFYDFFCNGDDVYVGINTYLEESRFQKISPKSDLDMFTVFLLFLQVSRQMGRPLLDFPLPE